MSAPAAEAAAPQPDSSASPRNADPQGAPAERPQGEPSQKPAPLPLESLDMERWGDIPYRIEVLVGGTRKTIAEILDLQEGDTIVLSRPAHEPVMLAIQGIAIGQAEVVSTNKGSSIQVTEVGLEE